MNKTLFMVEIDEQGAVKLFNNLTSTVYFDKTEINDKDELIINIRVPGITKALTELLRRALPE